MFQNHCVSPDLAKELKDLEFPQISQFYWVKSPVYGTMLVEKHNLAGLEAVAAPTAGEMLEWLPAAILVENVPRWLKITKVGLEYSCGYFAEDGLTTGYQSPGKLVEVLSLLLKTLAKQDLFKDAL